MQSETAKPNHSKYLTTTRFSTNWRPQKCTKAMHLRTVEANACSKPIPSNASRYILGCMSASHVWAGACVSGSSTVLTDWLTDCFIESWFSHIHTPRLQLFQVLKVWYDWHDWMSAQETEMSTSRIKLCSYFRNSKSNQGAPNRCTDNLTFSLRNTCPAFQPTRGTNPFDSNNYRFQKTCRISPQTQVKSQCGGDWIIVEWNAALSETSGQRKRSVFHPRKYVAWLKAYTSIRPRRPHQIKDHDPSMPTAMLDMDSIFFLVWNGSGSLWKRVISTATVRPIKPCWFGKSDTTAADSRSCQTRSVWLNFNRP